LPAHEALAKTNSDRSKQLELAVAPPAASFSTRKWPFGTITVACAIGTVISQFSAISDIETEVTELAAKTLEIGISDHCTPTKSIQINRDPVCVISIAALLTLIVIPSRDVEV
jgi:hypothetical protein